MKNAYFVMFHKTMKKYINSAGKEGNNNNPEENPVKRFSQCRLYNDLFEIQQKETAMEDGGISEAQICRWTSGKEAIPKWILSQPYYDTNGCKSNYSSVFEKYIDEINIFQYMEAEKKLAEEMCQLKMDWGISFACVTPDDNLWDILADTLVTALVCEYALNTVRLETGLKQSLAEMLKLCREKNVEFKTPFLLSVLFQESNSLLPYTLDKLEGGLGARWGSRIEKYISAEHSQTFKEIHLDDSKLLNYAKIRSCLNNKTELDELEFCCAIIDAPGSSNTLEKLKSKLCKYGYDNYKNWRELLLKRRKELQETSDDYPCSN